MPSTGQAKHGFFINGGLALKRVDGTYTNHKSGPYEITAPFFKIIRVEEAPSIILLTASKANPWGNNLSNRLFEGIDIHIGYQLSEHWSIGLRYAGYIPRTGRQKGSWQADSTGMHAGTHGNLITEFRIQQHDFQLMIERMLTSTGITISAGCESALQKNTQENEWYTHWNNGVTTVHHTQHTSWPHWWGALVGIGYQKPLTSKSTLLVSANYSFPGAVNGITCFLEFKRYLFKR